MFGLQPLLNAEFVRIDPVPVVSFAPEKTADSRVVLGCSSFEEVELGTKQENTDICGLKSP
jgi:hypothetical protein